MIYILGSRNSAILHVGYTLHYFESGVYSRLDLEFRYRVSQIRLFFTDTFSVGTEGLHSEHGWSILYNAVCIKYA